MDLLLGYIALGLLSACLWSQAAELRQVPRHLRGPLLLLLGLFAAFSLAAILVVDATEWVRVHQAAVPGLSPEEERS